MGWVGSRQSVACAVQRDHGLCTGRKVTDPPREAESFPQSIWSLSLGGKSSDTCIAHPCRSKATLSG